MRAPPIVIVLAVWLAPVTTVAAQDPQTRTAAIEQAEEEKAATVHPFMPGRAELTINRVSDMLFSPVRKVHAFWTNAYPGGGFPFGIGYLQFVSPYNSVDVRGSITISGYKRLETEFLAPRLFERRASLSVIGGWREATEVPFYGIGPNTLKDDRANYRFTQPYALATLTVRPTRRLFLLAGGLEFTKWTQTPSERGSDPSVETIYTPQTLAGLGEQPTYIHSQGTIALDSRPSPLYARRGGYYGVTVHDYVDTDTRFGFNAVTYEAIQHIPILRETWVLSLHGLLESTFTKQDQEIPFFMLPSLGSGSDLRGYGTKRFRDRNRLLLQGEWRVIVNRFFDTALFLDAGTVAPRAAALQIGDLRTDYGVGFRFHGAGLSALRVDVARSPEGFNIIFATDAPF